MSTETKAGECYTCKHCRPNAWGAMVCMRNVLRNSNARPEVNRAMLDMTGCKQYERREA